MPEGELILYRSPDGGSEIQLRATGGTVWLTQAEIAELFQFSAEQARARCHRVKKKFGSILKKNERSREHPG